MRKQTQSNWSVKSIIAVGLVIAPLSYVIHAFWPQLGQLDAEFIRRVLPWVGTAYLTLLVAYVLRAFGWAILAGGRHAPCVTLQFMSVHMVGQVGRYLPGKVWQFAGILYYAKRLELTREWAVASTLLVIIIQSGTGLLFGLPFVQNRIELPVGSILLLAGLVLGLTSIIVFFCRSRYSWIAESVSKVRGAISLKTASATIPLLALVWLLMGFALWQIWRGCVDSTPPPSIIHVTGILAVSTIAGMLAFLSPSGLGVKEAVIVVLLSGLMRQDVAAMIAIIMRIVMTTSEFLLAAASHVFLRRTLRPVPQQ